MGISTHILDTSRGRPAAGVAVTLLQVKGETVTPVASGETDADGRIKALIAPGVAFEAGTYRITFEVAAYFARLQVDAFYPRVAIDFMVKNPAEHFHVPLLLQPFGFGTYRGS